MMAAITRMNTPRGRKNALPTFSPPVHRLLAQVVCSQPQDWSACFLAMWNTFCAVIGATPRAAPPARRSEVPARTRPGARVVRFRVGGHEKALRGNVMGIGNSCAFVEPLESAGILMITSSVQALVASLSAKTVLLGREVPTRLLHRAEPPDRWWARRAAAAAITR
ncbi:hypothetical protein EKG83_15715 [Saccharothrix syringae]|uniref:Uncharacterized protein n=2 Tax=Saccharothrix syringae TaxID=103733 RepID=A0A5Q0GXT5_SACSY|nr:hypothetical protein EKG83_15715 [Saccharothrix syringae]